MASGIRDRLRSHERELVAAALKKHHGSVTLAAAELGCHARTLRLRLAALGLSDAPRELREAGAR